jgi:hypothetical protein
MEVTEHANRKSIGLDSLTLDPTIFMPRVTALPPHGLRLAAENRFATQTGTDTLLDPVPPLQEAPTKDGADDESQVIELQPTTSSNLLPVVVMNTRHIQLLLAYILQTLSCITHDFNTGLQFPMRLISNITAELQEKHQGDLITNLYHLALTGHYTPVVLEWLTDIVKETNHKRWDQAVTTMYKHIQDHLFMNLKPALDRMTSAVTTLRGYARYLEGTGRFIAVPSLFTAILEQVDFLRDEYHKMLAATMAEQKQFRAFSKWIRVMIDGTEEKDGPNIEYSLALQWIEGGLGGKAYAYGEVDTAGISSSVAALMSKSEDWIKA